MNTIDAHPSLAAARALLEAAQLPTADLTQAPPAIRTTREFAGICPASSAFMCKQL